MKTRKAKIYFTVSLKGNMETLPTPGVTFSIDSQPGIESVNVYQEIKKGEPTFIQSFPVVKNKPITKKRKTRLDLAKATSLTGWIKKKLGL